MSIENDAAKTFMDYGVVGVMLLASLWAILKMALNFKSTTDQHQQRIDKMNTEFLSRLEKKDAEHRQEIKEIIHEFKQEREQLSKIIECNTAMSQDLRELIEKRLIELRVCDKIPLQK